jgi:hypothetical protein
MAASINASTSAGVVTTADTTGNLNLQSNGATVLAMTSAGIAVTGTLIPSGKITATTAGIDVPTSALGTCYSGTYTPTITNATNTTQTTAIQCRYTRVGNLVTVYGKLNLAVNTPGLTTSWTFSLPVASSITANNTDATGVAVSETSTEVYGGIAGTGVFVFSGLGVTTANHGVDFTFNYIVQ